MRKRNSNLYITLFPPNCAIERGRAGIIIITIEKRYSHREKLFDRQIAACPFIEGTDA